MAHHKRKRARTSPTRGYSRNAMKHRLGARYAVYRWNGNYPRHHDKIFHTRPRRRLEKKIQKKVMKGTDPENLAWPVEHKPHIYYW